MLVRTQIAWIMSILELPSLLSLQALFRGSGVFQDALVYGVVLHSERLSIGILNLVIVGLNVREQLLKRRLFLKTVLVDWLHVAKPFN